ncbi:MAG: hypothetical protein Q4B54_09300, partial [Coriobacteriales bacterium]|nr:hypothetical protein [Coriobacteriales bacterium]
AHVVACMAEHDVREQVIGVSFDGTGYGTDGTIWGGEILLCDTCDFTRLGHIVPFAQAGGDLSSREGWRVATAMLRDMCDTREEALSLAEELGLANKAQVSTVLAMIERNVNTVASTSAGRLFDAVSAVLGVRQASTYEGEAATQLQFAAERGRDAWEASPLRQAFIGTLADKSATQLASSSGAEPFVLPTNELFAWIVAQRRAGISSELLAAAFHEGLAELVRMSCERSREISGVNTVALTGGCYQNLLLLELSAARLRGSGFEVLIHRLVPPNDGGIALGQAWVAASRLERGL